MSGSQPGMERIKDPSADSEQRTLVESPDSDRRGGASDPSMDVAIQIQQETGKIPPLSRLGDYELMREIGRGGMGVVYQARHVRLERVVALKMILGGSLANPEDLQRFEKEAAASAQLQHPGIVSLYEAGAFENQPFFSMEWVSGASLSQLVAGGPLPGKQAATFLEKTARAVHFAHGRGIIHRDLKPANVLLDEHGVPKITDFGLAKLLHVEKGQTRTGAVLGTPSYMAPEQAAGQKDIGPACDVYSLGAILYELLTGRAPFRGETALATLKLVEGQDPVAPRMLNPSVDRELETICLKCLEKDPDRRYVTAEDLADDLERYLQGEPIAARRLHALGRGIKWCRRKPAQAILLFVILAGLAGLVQIQWSVAKREYTLRKAAEDAQATMRHLLYFNEIRRVQHALEAADVDRAERLLSRWVPGNGDKDLRDWEWRFLKERCGGRFVLAGHKGGANAVVYRPDGLQLASAGGHPAKPGRIKLWDLATGKSTRFFTGHRDAITALAYSPDGKLLASSSYDKTVRVWDLETGHQLAVLRGHKSHVLGVAFSSNGRLLASGGGDKNVLVWDTTKLHDNKLAPIQVLKGHTRDISSLAFHPETSELASASYDRTIKLWDASTGKLLRTLTGHDGEVDCVAYSPGGRILASGGGRGHRRGEIRLWSSTDGKLLHVRYGLSDKIRGLAFSQDSKLAAAGNDGIIRIWDQTVSSEPFSFRGDTQHVFALAFSPDGQHVASAGRGGRINIWNSSGGLETRNLRVVGPRRAVAFSPGGEWLACAGRVSLDEGIIQLWKFDDTRDAPGIAESPSKTNAPGQPIELRGPRGNIYALAFAPDGKHLAAAGEDRTIYIYDLDYPQKAPSLLQGHGAPVRALAFHPEGHVIASASEDDTIRLWNLDQETQERILTGHRNGVLTIAWNMRGNLLVSGGFDLSVRLWNLANGKSTVLEGHTGSVNSVTFSLDDSVVVSASRDKTIRFWDIARGVEYLRLDCPAAVLGIRYHPAGRRLLSVGDDNAIRLWDLVAQQEIVVLEQAALDLEAAAFSPDGQHLAAIGLNTLRVWDAGSP